MAIYFLLFAAVLPVFGLCFYVYKMDTNKEPIGLLIKIFSFGLVSFVPILIVEMSLSGFFPTSNVSSFMLLFVNVFFGVSLVEEGFKWLVTKFFGYNDKNFDEIYDIIVFSVFASIGFACIENILYVFQSGLSTAIARAILSIPGHACFGVAMGCYLAKAKIASINNNKVLYGRNIYYSIFVPTFLHALYDSFIFYYVESHSSIYLLLFFVFDIVVVVICVLQVNRISKIQTNITNNVNNGSIVGDSNNHIYMNLPNESSNIKVKYCPVCGSHFEDANFCGKCGFKMR